MKLTKTSVEKLPLPESKQTFYWDAGLTGFGIRLTPNSRVYIVQARVNGKSRRVTLGKHGVITADQARDRAIKALAEMSGGVDPIAEKARKKTLSVTLREVADDYIKDRMKDNKLKPSTIKDINRHVDKNFSAWAKQPISSISRDKVTKKHDEISQRGKSHANQAFRYLRALLNYAIPKYRSEAKPVILENPVDVLSQLNLWNNIKPREIRIPDGKTGHGWNLLKSLREDPAQTTISRTNADLVTFLLLTGARWTEGAALTWERVDLKEGWFFLPDPKNRNPVVLPLSTEANKILSDRPRTNSFVFPARSKDSGHVKDARSTMKQLAEAIGIEKISAHDLRRTFINIALKSCKIDLWKAKLLTNHKLTSDVTIEHYSDKQNLRYLAPDTEQISSWIIEQGKIAEADNVISIDQARRA